MSDNNTTGSVAAGWHRQVIYNPETDDLLGILSAHPTEALLSAITVTSTQIVLRFGPASPA